jgi:hypothetical protein
LRSVVEAAPNLTALDLEGRMKPLLLAAMVSVSAVGAALEPGNLTSVINDIYPLDAAKRQALNLCMLRDPNFNRLASAAREVCYRHELDEPQLAAARATIGVAPNDVELHQAAAWENAPRNDIRVIEASQGFSPSLTDGPVR